MEWELLGAKYGQGYLATLDALRDLANGAFLSRQHTQLVADDTVKLIALLRSDLKAQPRWRDMEVEKPAIKEQIFVVCPGGFIGSVMYYPRFVGPVRFWMPQSELPAPPAPAPKPVKVELPADVVQDFLDEKRLLPFTAQRLRQHLAEQLKESGDGK